MDGDMWHDIAGTTLTTMPVATIDSGVFSLDSANWTGGGLPNHSYGPLDFKFFGGIPEPTTSLLRIERTGSSLQLILTGMAGSTYRVEKGNTITSWNEVGTYTLTDTELTIQTISTPIGTAFYRVIPLD